MAGDLPHQLPARLRPDSLAIEIIDAPSFASHEWLTTLSRLNGNNEAPAYCNGSSAATTSSMLLRLGPSGRVGNHPQDHLPPSSKLSTTTCVTDTTFEIEVAPKPSIAWVDINSVTAWRTRPRLRWRLSLTVTTRHPRPGR